MTTSLCRFKDAAGKPGEGMHRVRLFGMAAVDLIGTVAIGLVVWTLTRWDLKWLWAILAGLFLLAIVAHRVFCVDTVLNVFLFGRTT